MKFNRSLSVKAAAAVLGLLSLGAGTSALARDNVYWSLGVAAAPGVNVGVSNARPVVMQPAPVYVAPAPVYVQPQVVYAQPQVVYTQPQAVYAPGYYVQPAPVYYGRGWHHGHGHGHGNWR